MFDLQRYGLETEWPKLARLQAEVRELEQSRAQAEQEVAAARNAIPTAEQRDAEADAKAIRAGKGGTRAQHAAKARADLEDSERSLAAYTRALADAQSDLARFMTKHAGEIRAAIVAALREKARRLAEHSREAAVLYGQLEDARYDLRQFSPPPPPPDENAPAQRLSTTVIGVTTQRAIGPARGDVEQMLGYLASLEAQYAEGEEDNAA